MKDTERKLREELGQMVSLAWKNGIWHSEATLFKDFENFIIQKIQERDKLLVEKLKEAIGYGNLGFSNEKGEICLKLKDFEDFINNIEPK